MTSAPFHDNLLCSAALSQDAQTPRVSLSSKASILVGARTTSRISGYSGAVNPAAQLVLAPSLTQTLSTSTFQPCKFARRSRQRGWSCVHLRQWMLAFGVRELLRGLSLGAELLVVYTARACVRLGNWLLCENFNYLLVSSAL